jgi:hypothetical protein
MPVQNVNMWKPPASAVPATSNISAFMGVDLSQAIFDPQVASVSGNYDGGPKAAETSGEVISNGPNGPDAHTVLPPSQQQQMYSVSYMPSVNENEFTDVNF